MLDASGPNALARWRYQTESGVAYLTGIQALVRLLLDQRRLDAGAGLDTAGLVSGYRGSPLGGLDVELWRRAADLQAQRVVFQPGINEDLAATAIWGSQQVGLFPGARVGGVFGMWYGKAPGLDRSSDALRHANAAGTSPRGGVLAVVGDDHGCKSSTLPNASEFALRDLGIPVLAPADVQDVLDLGLFGWALSRYAGCWAGLIALTDVMDSAMSIDVTLARHHFACPPRADDPHIRLTDSPLEQEARLELKLRLATGFAAANNVNRVVTQARRPRLVVVAAGKTYADVREAFIKLGIGSDQQLAAAGVRLVKLGMTWPLDAGFVHDFCRDANRVLVVEEKRAFVEDQLRAMLFGTGAIEVLGKTSAGMADPAGYFPSIGELDPPLIATALAGLLGLSVTGGYLGEVAAGRRALAANPDSKQARKPLYCAGCPHSISTRVPAGSRAGAGIGCHYMAQWMDRDTYTVTHMGAEGVNWIGQAPFTDERHIFVNLGDGTYSHSGILAIRAAVAAGVNVTYKVLANDAVAMTGGQPVEGRLRIADLVAQVRAEGVSEVRVVSDDPRRHRGTDFPVAPRHQLDAVQRQLRELPGCTVLIYDQVCATELRRRRKRGLAVDPDVRVVINDAVCEGCGDCSVQSNCVAVVPLETEFGVKRAIDQSACNKDLSCLAGFCPAMVTLTGAKPRLAVTTSAPVEELKGRLPAPAPAVAAANILIAGVGGTGIVTVSQILATAAHLDGSFVTTLDMTGLAQKGGAVLGHVRISPAAAPHPPTRIPAASADLLIAADAVTAASRDALAMASAARTAVIVNNQLAPTAEFVLRQRPDVPASTLLDQLRRRARSLATVDANAITRALFGTTTTSNMLLLGHAFQAGMIPVSMAAIERAITMNGVAVVDNLAAFHHGRAAAHDPDLLPAAARAPRSGAMAPPSSRNLDERIARRRAFLVDYQDAALARRYFERVERLRAAERRIDPTSDDLAEAVADSYFRLLAIKDEYEVARLFTNAGNASAVGSASAVGIASAAGSGFATKLARRFQPGFKMTFHFAPPLFARQGPDGRPRKLAMGPWMLPILRLLAKLRRLRGGLFDPFRYSADRELERRLLAGFEADFDAIAAGLRADNLATAIALARLPATIKGFGPVKAAAAEVALRRRNQLMARFQIPPGRRRPIKDRSPVRHKAVA